MSFRVTAFKRSLLAAFALLACAARSFGQAADSPIVFSSRDAIVTSFVAPVLLGTSSGGQLSQWLKIEFHYAVTPKVGNFVDSAQFKVWVEGRDLFAADAPTKDGIAVGLTGSETYVNIPAGKDVYGVFYVHPDTLTRYSTSAGSSDFDRTFDIHLEAYVGGKKMDNIDKNKETDAAWYQKLRALPGLVYRQNQSPFLLADLGRYPAVMLPTESDAGGGDAGAAAPDVSGPVNAPAAPVAPPAQ